MGAPTLVEKNLSAANHLLRFFICAAINRKKNQEKKQTTNATVFMVPAAYNHLDTSNVAVLRLPTTFNPFAPFNVTMQNLSFVSLNLLSSSNLQTHDYLLKLQSLVEKTSFEACHLLRFFLDAAFNSKNKKKKNIQYKCCGLPDARSK